MEDLNISLVQSSLHWEAIDANLAMFEEYIWSIPKTDLIILPEMFSTGFSMNPIGLAEPVGGKTYRWMKLMARQRKSAILGSYIVKEGGHYYNRAYFVFPDGSTSHYDKKHLFALAGEGKEFTAGKSRSIVAYKGWKINLLICYDLRFPVWSRSQKKEATPFEYDVLVYCANWPTTRIDAWDTLLKARAIENLCFCVGVNRIGKDFKEILYPGHSAVYDFAGNQKCFSNEEPKIINTTLSASELQSYRDTFLFHEDADEFELLK